MDRRRALALLRIGFAALAVAAILTQMLDLAGKGVGMRERRSPA